MSLQLWDQTISERGYLCGVFLYSDLQQLQESDKISIETESSKICKCNIIIMRSRSRNNVGVPVSTNQTVLVSNSEAKLECYSDFPRAGSSARRRRRRSGDRITVAEVLTLRGQTPTSNYIFTPKLDNSSYTSHYHNPRQCHGRLGIAIVARHRTRLPRIRVHTPHVTLCHVVVIHRYHMISSHNSNSWRYRFSFTIRTQPNGCNHQTICKCILCAYLFHLNI